MLTSRRFAYTGITLLTWYLTSFASCDSKDDDIPSPPTAQWTVANVKSEATSQPVASSGYFESGFDNDRKMFVALSSIDTNVHRVAVKTWGSTLPKNTISIDFTQGTNVDYLTSGGDSASVTFFQAATVSRRRMISFDNLRVVKATSSGPSTIRDSATGWIFMPQ